jgi:hypothetical protein
LVKYNLLDNSFKSWQMDLVSNYFTGNTAWTVIDEKTVFVCGELVDNGYSDMAFVFNCDEMFEGPRMTAVQAMQTKRSTHGIEFDPEKSCVLVFGGCNEEGDISTAEFYSVA